MKVHLTAPIGRGGSHAFNSIRVARANHATRRRNYPKRGPRWERSLTLRGSAAICGKGARAPSGERLKTPSPAATVKKSSLGKTLAKAKFVQVVTVRVARPSALDARAQHASRLTVLSTGHRERQEPRHVTVSSERRLTPHATRKNETSRWQRRWRPRVRRARGPVPGPRLRRWPGRRAGRKRRFRRWTS